MGSDILGCCLAIHHETDADAALPVKGHKDLGPVSLQTSDNDTSIQ